MKEVRKMKYILAYDIGTTGVKTCLFRVGSEIEEVAFASAGYGLYTFPDGGAEQHTDEWWQAMADSTRVMLEKAPVGPEEIAAISFCSQMQGLVLVDENGEAVRHPMSYMDQRAKDVMERGIGSGFKIAGMNARKLIKSLRITGAVSGSVKDPMWKYLWVKEHEPDIFAKVRWWLDVKEYLIGRMTGNFIMTEDSAFSTILYDARHDMKCWSAELCQMFGVNVQHLPKIIKTSDIAGKLRAEQAAELGLAPGTPVMGGGGDASLIGIGAGASMTGQTHIYCGTSGWVSTVVEKQTTDTSAMIAAVVGAEEGKFNYFAEMETAGKCLEWVKDHLALDEIEIYLEKKDVAEDPETVYTSLYEYMSEVIGKCPAGAGGTIFTPWLHGNRCPFEDPNAAGMFFNIRLETGKTQMLRAVVEGVCFHLRWMLECQDKKITTSDVIRFCGGGALSSVTSQILADVTGRKVEVVAKPQNVGSVGAALTAAVGIGEAASIPEIASRIQVEHSYEPDASNRDVYDRNYKVFKQLYASNKKNFAALSGME